MSTQQLILRISVSFILAFLIGFERQYRRRSVGFRTYALVSIGSFLFVTFSVQTNSGDFTRIAAQVVSGMGFLDNTATPLKSPAYFCQACLPHSSPALNTSSFNT